MCCFVFQAWELEVDKRPTFEKINLTLEHIQNELISNGVIEPEA